MEGVPPAVHAVLDSSVLRADSPAVCAEREQLLAQVPSRQEAYVRVPKISTGSSAPAAGEPGQPHMCCSSTALLQHAILSHLQVMLHALLVCLHHRCCLQQHTDILCTQGIT